jgi:hypothetical protein
MLCYSCNVTLQVHLCWVHVQRVHHCVMNHVVTCSSRPSTVSLEPSPTNLQPPTGPPSSHTHLTCTCPSSRGPCSTPSPSQSSLRPSHHCISACTDPETSAQLTPTICRSTAPWCFLWLLASCRPYSCCSPCYDSCTTCPDSCMIHRHLQTDSARFSGALTWSSP